MDLDILLTVTSIAVAGITSVVGIWIERDPTRTKTLAYVLSGLIVMASFVSVIQSYVDEQAKQKMEADLARMLVMLNQIAAEDEGGSGELQALISSELNAQSRNNPNIINKVAQRISDNGGDPSQTLSSYLPKAEVESLSRRGKLTVKKRVSKKNVLKVQTKRARTTRVSGTPSATPVRKVSSSAPSSSTPPLRLTNRKPRSTSGRARKTAKTTTKRATQALTSSATRAKTRAKSKANQAKSEVKNRVSAAKNKAKSKAKRKANRAKNKAKRKANRAKNRAKKAAKQKLKSFGL